MTTLAAIAVDFKTSLTTAEQLILLEKSDYPDPLADNHRSIVNGLRGGAAVLMVASFEDFLSSLFKAASTNIEAQVNPFNFERLPSNLQTEATFTTLEAAMSNPVGQEVPRFDRLPAIRAAASTVSEFKFSAAALSRTNSNPDSKTLGTMFKRLGLKDPLSLVDESFTRLWFKPEANTFFRDKLSEIVQRRHQVAHTGQALSVPLADLDVSIKFLEIAADAISGVLETHVNSIIAKL